MEEKKMQRALMHFHKRENMQTVKKALVKAGRKDLIDVFYPPKKAEVQRDEHDK